MDKSTFLSAVRKKFPDGAHFSKKGIEDFAAYCWDRGNSEGIRVIDEMRQQVNRDIPDFMKELFK